jgi:hypothetical protein
MANYKLLELKVLIDAILKDHVDVHDTLGQEGRQAAHTHLRVLRQRWPWCREDLSQMMEPLIRLRAGVAGTFLASEIIRVMGHIQGALEAIREFEVEHVPRLAKHP